MLETIIEGYRQRTSQNQEKLSFIQKRIYQISSVRLILFLAGVFGVIYFWDKGWIVILPVVLICLIPFLILIKVHNRLFNSKEYTEKLIEINRNELSAIDYKTDCFEGGKEFQDATHAYTYDLDVFGEHSLFQYINRTSTYFGLKKLAGWLMTPLDKKEEIEQRQEAVRELTPLTDFRQNFQAAGMIYKGKLSDGENLLKWAQSTTSFRHRQALKFLIWLVPCINLLLLLLGIAGILSYNALGISFTLCLLASIALQKKITLFQMSYENKLAILRSYIMQIRLMEKLTPQSRDLKRCYDLLYNEKTQASEAITQLSKEMNALNQRNNMLAYIVLNGFLFWEIRQVMRIEGWKEKYATNLPEWLEAIGETDALCSLATFAYNHPDYTYPHAVSEPFTLCANRMGHPLIHRDRCVRNDIMIEKRPYFIIITGANMAGKSTYLRTIGVNYLLACTGAPVCADSMTFYPAHLVTSLRTTDSLNDNESYFFAELKRLKEIIERLNSGEELFIILDEILKGTNSVDKQKGSLSLIKQFIHLQANGIIATHDLQLGTLEQLYPEHICNYRFEASIANNELTFSYKMQKGIAQNMNACFLMKKMGIFVEEQE